MSEVQAYIRGFKSAHYCTQGNRQGLDMGTEYRSIILCEDEEQLEVARASKEARQVCVFTWATTTAQTRL